MVGIDSLLRGGSLCTVDREELVYGLLSLCVLPAERLKCLLGDLLQLLALLSRVGHVLDVKGVAVVGASLNVTDTDSSPLTLEDVE